MHQPQVETRMVEIEPLGERLSALRLCDAEALATVRRSLEQHGQLAALTLFAEPGGLEIIDGFYADPSLMQRATCQIQTSDGPALLS